MEQNVLVQFLPLILIFVVFYFLLIRPQQQRMKEHRKMLENLRRGDKVITGGGLVGEITKVDETELTLELAEGVRVKAIKGTIQGLINKSQPVDGEAPRAPDGEKKGGMFGFGRK